MRQCAASSPWERTRRCDAHDESSEGSQGSKPRWCDSIEDGSWPGMSRPGESASIIPRHCTACGVGFAKLCTESARPSARLAADARKCSKCSARIASESGWRKNTHAATGRGGANAFRLASPQWKRKSRACGRYLGRWIVSPRGAKTSWHGKLRAEFRAGTAMGSAKRDVVRRGVWKRNGD